MDWTWVWFDLPPFNEATLGAGSLPNRDFLELLRKLGGGHHPPLRPLHAPSN